LRTHAAIALERLGRSRRARVGALLLSCLALVATFADVLASDGPVAGCGDEGCYVLPGLVHESELASLGGAAHVARFADDAALWPPVRLGPLRRGAGSLEPPSWTHPLGTDEHGRDVLARLVHGARTALGVSAAAIGLGLVLGVLLGGLAGSLRGRYARWLERLVDTVDTFPAIIVVAILRAIEGEPSPASLIAAVAIVRWAEVARLVRTEVLRASGEGYALAARALGASRLRVLFRHVLPNAVGPVVVSSVFGVASVTLLEAAISFLSMGGETEAPSWGELIAEAVRHPDAPWPLLLAPVALLATTVLASYLLADALRDALDPHTVRLGRER
jgi:peptide/nickel transport system permease protein